jgi:formate hydrogenlyase subunit 6/NADH:ubiquinone oxidoreductase subunit I
MCPIPNKAILLQEGEDQRGIGQGNIHAPKPVVLSSRCIGCGLCEKRCPLSGESAIRVYSPNEPPPPAGYV